MFQGVYVIVVKVGHCLICRLCLSPDDRVSCFTIERHSLDFREMIFDIFFV